MTLTFGYGIIDYAPSPLHACHVDTAAGLWLSSDLLPGVLAGAIDYYIIAKINNLRSDAVYVKVCALASCCCSTQMPVLPNASSVLFCSQPLAPLTLQ